MRVLHSVATHPLSRVRSLSLLIVAIAGVVVGLLGMHVLGGGSQAALDAPTAPGAVHVMAEPDPTPAGYCDAVGCDELGLMAATCVIALLALTLLAPFAHRLLAAAVAKPWATPLTPVRRPAPAPSLIALSVSRT
jgi:hypothetical protein